MLRKIGIRIRDPESESAESESGTEIADSGFPIIHKKQAGPRFGLPSLENIYDFHTI